MMQVAATNSSAHSIMLSHEVSACRISRLPRGCAGRCRKAAAPCCTLHDVERLWGSLPVELVPSTACLKLTQGMQALYWSAVCGGPTRQVFQGPPQSQRGLKAAV